MSFDFPSSGLTVGEIITGPNGIQYRWDGTKWVSVTTATGSYLPTTGGTISGNLTVTGTTALDGTTATTPAPGDNSTNVATTAFVDAALAAGAGVTISDTAPASPAPGKLWYDSVGLQTYIWYDDPTSSQWVPTTNVGGLLTDAPSNGTAYGRLNGAWAGVLPLTGGTLTGPLDITGVFSGGTVTYAFSMAVDAPANNAAMIRLNGQAGANKGIMLETGGVYRWLLASESNAETGNNVGSDFAIFGYDDAGTALTYKALEINRANGQAVFSSSVFVDGTITSQNGQATCILNKNSTSVNSWLIGNVNNVTRWLNYIGDSSAETGSNVGSNYYVVACNDAGSYNLQAIGIPRNTAVVNFPYGHTDGSDFRQKQAFTPIIDGLDRIKQLSGVSYERIARPGRRELGLVAQDLRLIVPEAVEECLEPGDVPSDKRIGTDAEPMLGINYNQITALLIEAVKTLSAELDALKAQVGAA